MTTPSLRQRLAHGEALVGTFCAIAHPAATEMVAQAGFDFLCLDAEHSAIDRGTAEEMVRAAAAAGVPALIRVAANTPELIGAALDAGAAGVVVPRVNSADEAAAAVSASRYPPLGNRGAGPGRASAYGSELTSYVASANDDLLLAVQVESAQAVSQARAIAAVDGVDLLFLGPGDLAVSLAADRGEPVAAAELSQVMTGVVGAASTEGTWSGLFRMDGADVGEWTQRGASLFIIGAESIFMITGAAQTARHARAQILEASGV